MHIPQAPTPHEPLSGSACDALARLRAGAGETPIGAIVSGGTGEWSRRSLVGVLGERIAVDNPADLPGFLDAVEATR